ncbi:MAG: hypothetical protein KDC38_01005 [Planctomycetes bacterium]|nr:hypothetical protein [Planctomycetota bacterium]
MSPPKKSGVGKYLKAAFTYRWNLLLGFAATAFAAMSGYPEVALPIVAAAETAYLTSMVGSSKFRDAVDAREHKRQRSSGPPPPPRLTKEDAVDALVEGLSNQGRLRFERLRYRCLEMQKIAQGVGGRTHREERPPTEFANPGLDRLLWMFLRLLHSQASLSRFLDSTDQPEIVRELEETRRKLEEARASEDERLIHALQDSLATRELRLDNYAKAERNAEFVQVELDRLEGKIQTLSEMAINRQDPDFLTREVDSVAESMEHTEAAMEELHLVDGLIEDLDEPPPILYGWRRDLRDEA